MTPELLRAATGCTAERAELLAQHITEACEAHYINTPARLAAFLGQIAHESGSLRYLREIAIGDAYEGRADLGNVQPGDGRRYRGRGLIQITGRANYRETAGRMRSLGAPDFEQQPEALGEPKWAAWSAANWWAAHGCNALADQGAYVQLGRLINRGNADSDKPANGEDDRLERWARAKVAVADQDTQGATIATAPIPTQPDFEPQQEPAAVMPGSVPSPVSTPAAAHPSPEPPPMPSFGDIIRNPATAGLLGLVNPLLALVPEVAKIFMDKTTGRTVPERNVAAAVKIADVALGALVAAGKPAANMQQVIETIDTDPAAKQIVRSAVLDQCMHLVLVDAGGGGIDGARKMNAAYGMPEGPRFWFNPAYWVSMILLTFPTMLLVDVFYVHPASYVGEIRTQIVTGILMVIGMVGGYWIGTSMSSAKKDERQAP